MPFGGDTYQRPLDQDRLLRQLERVKDAMRDGEWRTLAQIQALTMDPMASISARLRDLRKDKFGGHLVQRRWDQVNSRHEYRWVQPGKGGQFPLFDPPGGSHDHDW